MRRPSLGHRELNEWREDDPSGAFDPVFAALPVVALVGFMTAALTRSDRTRWSLGMKVALILLILPRVMFPAIVVFRSSPPPGVMIRTKCRAGRAFGRPSA